MNRVLSARNLAFAATIAGMTVSGVVHAALNSPISRDKGVTVSYADLDLNSMDGIKTLYQRLKTSARQVCGGNKGIETIDSKLQRRLCVETALNEAVSHIDNSLLQKLHVQER